MTTGILAPAWPEGDAQRPAIVGTVIRTLPHAPDRQAGQTYSFVAVNQSIPSVVYQLPENVFTHFADRVHRLLHAVWHGIRGSWNDLEESDRQALAQLDWRIPDNRVSLVSGAERTRPCVTNGSGEDFLFFHRQMVVQYKQLMAEAKAPLVEWRELPQPGAGGPNGPSNSVPPAWEIPEAPNFRRRLVALKTDEFFWSRMRWWEFQFKQMPYLATLTLGELGSLLEFSVHNDMHMRWSALPRDPETNTPSSFGRPDFDISAKWDSPRYNWLGEFYSSHVNPLFWRLHGWIDDRIDDWFAAHEWKHAGEVKKVEKGGVTWFAKGNWVQIQDPWVWPNSLGGYGYGHDHHDPDLRAKRIASAEKVMAILFPPPAPAAAASDRSIRWAGPTVKRTSVIGF